jgi:hypothetical protein
VVQGLRDVKGQPELARVAEVQPLIRDEGVAGSNPVNPTITPGRRLSLRPGTLQDPESSVVRPWDATSGLDDIRQQRAMPSGVRHSLIRDLIDFAGRHGVHDMRP